MRQSGPSTYERPSGGGDEGPRAMRIAHAELAGDALTVTITALHNSIG